jgi:hypothetical protein
MQNLSGERPSNSVQADVNAVSEPMADEKGALEKGLIDPSKVKTRRTAAATITLPKPHPSSTWLKVMR